MGGRWVWLANCDVAPTVSMYMVRCLLQLSLLGGQCRLALSAGALTRWWDAGCRQLRGRYRQLRVHAPSRQAQSASQLAGVHHLLL